MVAAAVADTDTTAAPGPTPNKSPAVIVSGTAGRAKTSRSVYRAPYAGYLQHTLDGLGWRRTIRKVYMNLLVTDTRQALHGSVAVMNWTAGHEVHLAGPHVSRTATKCSMKSFSSCLYTTPMPMSRANPVSTAAGAAKAASFPPSSTSPSIFAACFREMPFLLPLPLLEALALCLHMRRT